LITKNFKLSITGQTGASIEEIQNLRVETKIFSNDAKKTILDPASIILIVQLNDAIVLFPTGDETALNQSVSTGLLLKKDTEYLFSDLNPTVNKIILRPAVEGTAIDLFISAYRYIKIGEK